MSTFSAQPYYGYPYQQNTNSIDPYFGRPMNAFMPSNAYQPQPQISYQPLRGRIVNSQDEITHQEVAMDGGYSVFPLSDGSAVYMKAWGQDGKINTFKYVQEVVETDDIVERLDRIEKMLKQRNTSSRTTSKSSSKQEKEESNE